MVNCSLKFSKPICDMNTENISVCAFLVGKDYFLELWKTAGVKFYVDCHFHPVVMGKAYKSKLKKEARLNHLYFGCNC